MWEGILQNQGPGSFCRLHLSKHRLSQKRQRKKFHSKNLIPNQLPKFLSLRIFKILDPSSTPIKSKVTSGRTSGTSSSLPFSCPPWTSLASASILPPCSRPVEHVPLISSLVPETKSGSTLETSLEFRLGLPSKYPFEWFLKGNLLRIWNHRIPHQIPS